MTYTLVAKKKKFNHAIEDYDLHAKWLHAKFEVPMLQGSNDTSAVCCFIALVSRRWYSIVMYNYFTSAISLHLCFLSLCCVCAYTCLSQWQLLAAVLHVWCYYSIYIYMPPLIHLSQLLWIACSFTSREVYQYSTTTVHSILCSLPELASNLLVFCSTPRSYYLLHMVLHYALALQPRGFSISVFIWICINMLLQASPLEGPPKIGSLI